VSLALGRWRRQLHRRWLEIRAALLAAALLGWRRCRAALVLLFLPLVRAARAAGNALGFRPGAWGALGARAPVWYVGQRLTGNVCVCVCARACVSPRGGYVRSWVAH
jgi:hypothetical protein